MTEITVSNRPSFNCSKNVCWAPALCQTLPRHQRWKGRQSLGLKKFIVYWGVAWMKGEWQAKAKQYWEEKAVEEGDVGIMEAQRTFPALSLTRVPGLLRAWNRGWDGGDRLPPRSHSPATSSPTSRGGQWDKREGGRAQPFKITLPLRTRHKLVKTD